ncbi:hypothetical protein [Streptomyces longisporoflavus]|uniref:RNA-directed DNA polymerase n=1 Tax=Streptomyces longisporoflavus TaxID=28044 RepID=A0ABW7R478_9ACTN
MTDETPWNRTLSAAFEEDLLTDYVPDALGAADIRHRLARGRALGTEPLNIGQLQVPLARRVESIPVLSCAGRAHLLRLTEQALAAHTPRREVFSYRSPRWQYRSAYQARQHHLRALAARPGLPLVLVLDIHRFGRSLPLDTLLRAPWMTEHLAGTLADLERAAGRLLLPGHRWANRLGTAALAPLDDTMAVLAPGRWARWGDDLHVFVRDRGEADTIRSAVATVLAPLGLRLSPDKCHVASVASVLAGPARVIAGRPQELWRTGLANADERALRYALSRTPPDDEVSQTLVGALRGRDALLPRAVHYLDRAAHTPSAQRAATQLLHTAEPLAFTAARLLPLAGRRPHLAREVPDRLLDSAEASGFLPLRELAYRVDILRGRRRPHAPSPRIQSAVLSGLLDPRQLPQTTTLL